MTDARYRIPAIAGYSSAVMVIGIAMAVPMYRYATHDLRMPLALAWAVPWVMIASPVFGLIAAYRHRSDRGLGFAIAWGITALNTVVMWGVRPKIFAILPVIEVCMAIGVVSRIYRDQSELEGSPE